MITFHKIRFKNILSFGNMMTEIELDRHPITIIQGKNGGGKSTILDAICYSLFGKPFRKINLPKLINHKNKRELLTEIEFSVKNDRYMIRRGMNPQVFEIYKNNELINQGSSNREYQEYLEKNILNFDYNSFTQIVILGKATYVSFMRLTADQRRKFIESILGLNIFSAMIEVHREKFQNLKEKLNEVKNALIVTKDKIEVREKYISQLKSDALSKKEELIQRIDSQLMKITKEIEEIEKRLSELENQKTEVDEQKMKSIEKKIEQMRDLISKSEIRLSQVTNDIKFFEENDLCPVCKQEITEQTKEKKKNEFESMRNEIEKIIRDLNEKIAKYITDVNEMRKISEKNYQINEKIAAILALKKEKMAQIFELENEKMMIDSNEDNTKIQEEEKNLERMKEIYEKLVDKKASLVEEYEYFEIIHSMLKDSGIKRMVIRRYIPLINRFVNMYLKKLGFFAKFSLDEEFNEKILARGIDELSYYNFSEGEKLRIDLAILMTWREIAKIQNKMNTNLLIFDEIFDSSMDQSGVDAFVDLLKELKGTNTFVISHTPDKFSDKFTSSITFSKEGGFSKMN